MRFRRVCRALLPALGLLLPAAADAQVRLNEIRLDNVGGIDEEYIEIEGPPGFSLNGLSIVVLGDGGTDQSGTVEYVLDLDGFTIPGDGRFLIADSIDFGNGALGLSGSVDLATPINLEDGNNRTVLLVAGRDSTLNAGDGLGNGGSDVDQNADGFVDDPCNCTAPPGPPWTSVVDAVAVVQSLTGGNLVYSANTVGPDGANAPAQVYRCNLDPFDWRIGPPDLATSDTPGTSNAPVCGSGIIDRQTAIQIFTESQNPADPDTATTAAYLYLLDSSGDSTLAPGDVVADVDSTFVVPIVNPTYLFWVDRQVDHFYGHRTEFVLVDATNGFPVTIPSTTWPVVNDVEVDEFVVNNQISPNLLFGAGFLADLQPMPMPAPAPQPAKNVWGFLVAGKNLVTNPGASPDEPAIRGDAARGYRFLNGGGFGGPEIPPGNITTLIDGPNGGTGATPDQIMTALCNLGAQPQRCDKLFFLYYGHGTKSGKIVLNKPNGTKTYLTYKELAAWLKKANAKEVCILLMDCYSGTSIKEFAAAGLKGVVVTSSDLDNPTFRQGDGSAFMYGFMRCMLTPVSDLNGDNHKTLAEILAWTVAASDSANVKKPQAVVLTGGKPETVDPPECVVYDEKNRKWDRKRIKLLPHSPFPLAGGRAVDGADETEKDATLIYEIKEFTYDDPAAAAGGKPAKKVKRWLYVQNPFTRKPGPTGAQLGTVRPRYKVKVYCVDGDTKTPVVEIFPELEGERRFCFTALPEGCETIQLERGAEVGPRQRCPPSRPLTEKPGVLSAANVLDHDNLEGAVFQGSYDPGEFVFVGQPIAADSLTAFAASVVGPPGWGAAVEPSAPFFIPSGCDSEMVFLRATVPPGATAGGFLTLTLIDLAASDTMQYVYNAMLVDTLAAPVTGGDLLLHRSVHSTAGIAITGGQATLEQSALNIRANTLCGVGPGGSLVADFSSIYVDSAWTCPFVVSSAAVDWHHFAVNGADNGIVFATASGTIFGGASERSRGDGVTFQGADYANLDVDFLSVDECAGDGLVLNGATNLLIRSLAVEAAGGVPLRVENGSSVELVDAALDTTGMVIDATSTVTRSWTRFFRAVAANGDSLANTEIIVVDALGDTVAADTTDVDGYTRPFALREWTRTGDALTVYNPYTVYACLGYADTTIVDTVDAHLGVIIPLDGIPSATGIDNPGPKPTLRLAQNFPNPFPAGTRIAFTVPERGPVRMEVLDAAGRLVAVPVDRVFDPGDHEVAWRADSRLASGIYFYRLTVGGATRTRKMVLMR